MSDSSTGDLLLFALSGQDQASWDRFTRLFDASTLASARVDDPAPIAIRRWRAAQLLSDLAHIDLIGAQQRTAAVAQPCLARLPAAGLPTFVLCGRRTPTTLSDVQAAIADLGEGFELLVDAGGTSDAPKRIAVRAPSLSDVGRLAEHLGIPLEAEPPAWRLLAASGALDEYESGIRWEDGSSLNWEARYFLPHECRFSYTPPIPLPALRLVEYTNPDTHAMLSRLYCDGRVANVDKVWGRFLVLRDAGVSVLNYDVARFAFAVPWGAPLPAILARALTMCTGYAPDERPGASVYRGVQPEIADRVLQLLGQGS